VELRLQGIAPVGSQRDPARIEAAQRAAVKRSLGDGFLASCEKLNDNAIDCALAARDRDALHACQLSKK
jgi:hypothetical protein